MESLLNKRKIIKGRITRIENISDQQLEPNGMQVYLKKLESLQQETDEWQNAVIEKCKEDEYAEHEATYNELTTRIEKLSLLFTSSTPVETRPETTRNRNAEVRLPKLELPIFSGNYTEWLPFRDLFTATIHDNQTLSGAQKMQYLRASLKDEAALLVQSIPLSNDNYTESWDILLNRFDNNREIVEAHVKRLFDQAPVKEGTAEELRHLIANTGESIRTLKVLKQPVQHWDSLLLHIVKTKLDVESLRQWELSLQGKDMPVFSKLVEFLEQRARALSASRPSVSENKNKLMEKRGVKFPGKPFRQSAAAHVSVPEVCKLCGESHAVYKCATFLKAVPEERKNLAKQHSLCFNCLKDDHAVSRCKAGPCRKCQYRHHTLLHFPRATIHTDAEPTNSEPKVLTHVSNGGLKQQVLLATAVVYIKDASGHPHSFRALLDSASQASFVTQKCVQTLRMKVEPNHVSVSGIGAVGVNGPRGSTRFELYSRREPNEGFPIQAIILQKITKDLPSFPCDPKRWCHLTGLELADPTYCSPGAIDLLLGADVYMDLLRQGHVKGNPGTPSAFNTVLGWAIMGPSSVERHGETVAVLHCNVDEQLKRFWEIEEIPQGKPWSYEEERCEEIFAKEHLRDETGRYIVPLLFVEPLGQLGESRTLAQKQFLQIERKMKNNPELKDQYRKYRISSRT